MPTVQQGYGLLPVIDLIGYERRKSYLTARDSNGRILLSWKIIWTVYRRRCHLNRSITDSVYVCSWWPRVRWWFVPCKRSHALRVRIPSCEPLQVFHVSVWWGNFTEVRPTMLCNYKLALHLSLLFKLLKKIIIKNRISCTLVPI